MEHELELEDKIWATFTDQPHLKVARFNTAIKMEEDEACILELHHLVGRLSGVEYFLESHKLGVYTENNI